MPIITISRGSYSRGKEVAEKLAEKLGYECVSRDILLEASREFNIPEIKLVRALHDPASVLNRFSHGKERYLGYYRSALFTHLKQDNVVYHGLAGHFFLQNVSHVIKVRILSDIEDRVKEEMKREGVSAEQALYNLKKDDEERRKWGLQVYGKDTCDASLYDIVINIKAVTVDDAVQLLTDIAAKPQFQATSRSRRIMSEAALIADIEARLVDYSHRVSAQYKDGVVLLSHVGEDLKHDAELRARIEQSIEKLDGVDKVVFSDHLSDSQNYINVFHKIR